MTDILDLFAAILTADQILEEMPAFGCVPFSFADYALEWKIVE